jgi:hypothetical protein
MSSAVDRDLTSRSVKYGFDFDGFLPDRDRVGFEADVLIAGTAGR